MVSIDNTNIDMIGVTLEEKVFLLNPNEYKKRFIYSFYF